MRGAIKKRRKDQRGFTLLELAIAVLVAGILLGGALFILNQAENKRSLDITRERMNRIVEALATYADSAGRLPCPADPGRSDELFGWEWGVLDTRITANTNRPMPGRDGNCGGPGQQQCSCRDWSAPPAAGGQPRNAGIVPFLTLGLSPSVVRDGWGRYFTYAVSPVFARNNDDLDPTLERNANQDTGQAHVKCLDGAWFDSKDNVNAVKAKFCCARDGTAAPFDPDSDINIVHTDGNPVWPAAGGEFYDDERDTAPEHYHAVDPHDDESEAPGTRDVDSAMYPTVTSTAPFIADAPPPYISAPAFVLISHGINGSGAYLGDNTRGQYAGLPAASAMEQENMDFDDNVFREGPIIRAPGAAYFDDIVVWRTQDGILAETGASTCGYP